jgi:hypothetical protein
MIRLTTLLCLLLATAAQAEDLIAGVRARMVAAPVLRGEFEQHKTVKGFKKPLVSRGDFLIVQDRGVLWDTRKPFASSLTVTPTSLTAVQGEGKAGYHLDARREPALAAVNGLLLALLSGDLDALGVRFRVEGALLEGGSWRLVLTPIEVGLSRIFRRVRLEGDRHVRRVHLEEAQGDESELRFESLATTPPPSPAEADRLAK